MISAVLGKQLIITVDNQVGALAEASRVVATEGINLIAVCAHVIDNKGIIIFISEDNSRAKNLLKARKYDVREEEAVIATLENKPGALKTVTEKIAQAGVDLTLLYGSVDKKARASTIVIVSDNNSAVLAAITQ